MTPQWLAAVAETCPSLTAIEPLKPFLAALSEQPITALAGSYCQARPFSHLVIDNFLATDFAASLEDAARAAATPVDSSNGFTQSRKLTLNDWALMNEPIAAACSFFNCGAFISFLEAVCGLEGLIADPHLEGGGIHRTFTGGFLKMHTDFNWHQRLRLHRRVNVLYYLNRDYQPAWGGQLRLSRHPATQRLEQMRAIEPRFNRLVLFNTNDTTFHGHPEPHGFPADYPRTSLAFYYYTADVPPLSHRRRLRTATTRYVAARQERLDLARSTWKSRLGYLLRRWTPLG